MNLDFAGQSVALVGPTASGKTAVGILLAKQLDTEIINADSMQVYRYMDVGTAKPTVKERAAAVFHGLDVVDPDQEWTLADFQSLGTHATEDIKSRGHVPLIVGGAGLYIRALTTRLSVPSVPPNPERRAYWIAYADEHGNHALQLAVAVIDPEAAVRIGDNDRRRMVRALEVHESTGLPISEWHRRNREMQQDDNVLLFGLHYADRRTLYRRIEDRVDTMIQSGFVNEIVELQHKGYGRDLKPMQSLGYKQLCQYVVGEIDLTTAIDDIKRETRHFARRQLIWFRADPRIQWLEAEGKTAAQLADEIWVQLGKCRSLNAARG